MNMDKWLVAFRNYWAWILIFLFGIACLLLLLLQGFNCDEHMHIHFQWLISSGKRPGVDFLCHYPNLFYYIYNPFFSFFPYNHVTLLVHRFVVFAFLAVLLVIASYNSRKITNSIYPGLFALLIPATFIDVAAFREFRPDLFAYALFVSSFLLLMYQDGKRNFFALFFAAFLATFSLLVMPKHVYICIAVFLGYLVSCYPGWKRMLKTFAIWVSGAVACVLLGFFITSGNIIATWNALQIVVAVDKANPSHLFNGCWDILMKSPNFFYIPILLIGIIGLVRSSNAVGREARFVLYGLAAGIVFSLISIHCVYSQYTMPILVFSSFFGSSGNQGLCGECRFYDHFVVRHNLWGFIVSQDECRYSGCVLDQTCYS